MTVGEQFVNAAAQGIEFGDAEKQIEGTVYRFGIDETLQRLQVCEQLFLDWFAGELPDNGAQLILMMEADAVVDGPHVGVRRFAPPAGDGEPAVLAVKTVAGLAVGIVDEEVEEGQAAQCGGVAGILAHIEVVEFRVALDEKLDAARPARTIAQDGWGHEAPTEGFADDEGCGLPLAKRAGREIPQGIFAAAGLVDGGDLVLLMMDGSQKGVVGAVWQEPFFFDCAFRQGADNLCGCGRGRPATVPVRVLDATVVHAAHLLFDGLIVLGHSGKPNAGGVTGRVTAPCGARHVVGQRCSARRSAGYTDNGNAWPFVRGQKWPSGSMTRPHRGHSGLPAATTCRACSLNERICARVA